MKFCKKKIASIVVALTTVLTIAVSASAITPFVSDRCDFTANSTTCWGTLNLYATSPQGLIVLNTYANSGSATYETMATYSYTDTSGNMQRGTNSGSSSVRFYAPGKYQMCSAIFGTHRVTINDVLGFGNTSY